jgi:tetratricopeptide (TPR) repeat protein
MPDTVQTGTANGAVFLSYASQDVEAAKRICDTLRAASIEVWFDQSELVGGDKWDVKIRGQISSCALFVPVISANTQARREGYFRLEWKLAAQRTHMMSERTDFLLPVIIDGTREAGVDVPGEFRAVQWTRLSGGETPSPFVGRVKTLLGGDRAPESGYNEGGVDRMRKRPAKRAANLWLASFGLVVFASLVIWRPWGKPVLMAATGVPAEIAKPAAPMSEARRLTARAEALDLDDPNFSRENVFLADDLCSRALALDASDAEIWAMAAFVSQDLITETYEDSSKRRELAHIQAERAISLDPHSIRAGLAVARNFRVDWNLPEATRLLRELRQRAPNDRLVLRELARTERASEDDAGVRDVLNTIEKLPGGDPRTLVTEVKDLRNLGRFREAEALDDRLLAGPPVRLAFYEKLLLLSRSWSDLGATGEFIGKIPPGLQQEDAFASLIAQFWLWKGNGDKALEALAKAPHDYLDEFAADEPKSYLIGWAHRIAGRMTAAQAEWQNALALVESRLASDKSNLHLLTLKASLQALLGQNAAARGTWKLRVELGGTTSPDVIDEIRIRVLLGDDEEAISVLLERWPTMDIGLRGFYFSELRYAPEFTPIRNDPRVRNIIDEEISKLEALRHPSG